MSQDKLDLILQELQKINQRLVQLETGQQETNTRLNKIEVGQELIKEMVATTAEEVTEIKSSSQHRQDHRIKEVETTAAFVAKDVYMMQKKAN